MKIHVIPMGNKKGICEIAHKYRKFYQEGRQIIKERPMNSSEISIFRMSYNILPSVHEAKETDKPLILEVGFRIPSTHKEFEEVYMLYDNIIRTILADSASLDKKIDTIINMDFIETFCIY